MIPISVSGMQIGLAIAVTGAVADLVRGRRPPRTPLDTPILVFLGITLISSLLSSDPGRSLRDFAGGWTVLVLYLIAGYLREEDLINRLLRCLFWPATFVAVYAVAQHFTGWDLLRDGLAALAPLEPGGRVVYLPQGTFSHHQTFANSYYMLFCLSLSLMLGLRFLAARLAWSVPTFLIGIALAFSYTRGIWLAALFAVVFISVLHNPRVMLKAAAVLLLVAIVTVLSSSGIASRARSIFELKKNVDRLLIWETSWNMIRDYPLLGVGVGNYRQVQSEYIREEITLPMSRSHSHNILMQVAAERGIFGLLAFFWLWYVLLQEGFTTLRRLRFRAGLRYSIALGSLAGVIGFFLDGFFQNNFGDTEVVTLFWVLVGLIMLCRENSLRGDLQPSGS
jgi:O-antigen ligase